MRTDCDYTAAPRVYIYINLERLVGLTLTYVLRTRSNAISHLLIFRSHSFWSRNHVENVVILCLLLANLRPGPFRYPLHNILSAQ